MANQHKEGEEGKPKHSVTINFDDAECDKAFIELLRNAKLSDESFIETANGRFYPLLELYVPKEFY